MMEAQARQTFILMSHRKLRRVVNTIRGKSATEAMGILRLMPYDAARVVYKKLNDAIHNARVKYGADLSNLMVHKVLVDEGPAYRRIRPRAQGRVYRREKPTAHLTVCVKVVNKREDA
jgi:large subunit ribosomal protein L22